MDAHKLQRNTTQWLFYSIQRSVRYSLAVVVWIDRCNHSGMPLNQLGTLSGRSNCSCDAAFFYLLCLSTTHPFDGAKENLQMLFQRNEKRSLELTKQQTKNRNEKTRCVNLNLLWKKEFELKVLSFPVVTVIFVVFWSSFYKCLINYSSLTICKFLFDTVRTQTTAIVWLPVARFRIWVNKRWTISMLVCSIKTIRCFPTISFSNFCQYLWSLSTESNVRAVEQWNVCGRTSFVLQPCMTSISSRTDTLCRNRLCCGALLAHCQSYTHSFPKCLLSAAWRTNEDRWKWFRRGRRTAAGTKSNE